MPVTPTTRNSNSPAPMRFFFCHPKKPNWRGCPMAEDANTPEADGGPDPAAIAAALGRSSPAIDAELIAYLHAQRHHLNAQRLASVWEKWLGVFLRAATACVGVAVAGGIGFMVWQAAHSDGLKVEPFSVPPAMAERGLTGEVVAARVIDRLSALQSQTNTGRPGRSYSNAWGEQAIKLEIPEAGVSLAELNSWLRETFGHETALTGEVVRTDTGVTLTARAGEDGAVSVSGPEADMDALTVRLAEAIYRVTQPYRYAIYLMRHENRPADAAPIFQELALHGGPQERRWSYGMWADATELATGDHELGLRLYQEAQAADPDAAQPILPATKDLIRFGRSEEALQVRRMFLQKFSNKVLAQSYIDEAIGAYGDARPVAVEVVRKGLPGFALGVLLTPLIETQIGLHEITAARANLARYPSGIETDPVDTGRITMRIGVEANDWQGVLAHEKDAAAYLKHNPRGRHDVLVNFVAFMALARAQLGDFAAAERSIAPMPGDCYPCLIIRAQIAELAGQRARADFWFDRATAAGPSLPFAFEAQGRALLGRGQPDAAIARFTIANQKSPHFADPLEGWGEALMAKNRSDLALAKFADADTYAPNWGRLHLKWGEALAYAGKPADAKQQFARAAGLDLTQAEKSELAGMSHG
jgi:tetratricopeptide (TPR) repeat protein